MITIGVKTGRTKEMKKGSYKELDAALYIWFRQQQEKNVPVSEPLLQEKPKLLFEQLYPDSPKPISASTGFQWRFGKRHGIKNISIQGEKESADMIFAADYQFHFNSMIADYSHEQVFNCDETGLQFRLLLQKTLASLFERQGNKVKIE